MKVHSFTFDAAAYATEAYITTEKYKDIPEHNQFDRIKAHYEMQRFKKMFKEFTNNEMILDLNESKE